MRRPTMEDVAQRAGVSRSVVSLVMRNRPEVSAGRRQAVLAAAEALNYRPHALAQGLASHQSSVLAVLASDLLNPYICGVTEVIEQEARGRGYETIIASGGRSPQGEQKSLTTLLGFRPAGIILVGSIVRRAVLVEASSTTPTVAVARPTLVKAIDTVQDDGYSGSGLVVDHLVALGHVDIVHLDGGNGAQAAQRKRGYTDAMRRHGLKPWVEPSQYTADDGAESARRLLRGRRRFTAVVAANDVNALGAMTALDDAGLAVPDDVSVVGYDNTPLAGLRQIGLTTVDQPVAAIARLAVEAFLSRVNEQREAPVRHLLTPHLVVRRTTARPR